MGYYINPIDKTKEEWLMENGLRALSSDKRPEGFHFVCLVDNGGFTAAGIAFNDQEKEAFMHPDNRHKYWFIVADEKLIEVEPSVKGSLS